jgi:hypothetical protein
MSESSFRKYYAQSEFVAMNTVPVDAAQFETHLTTLSFSVPVVDVYEVNGSIAVEFSQLPTPGDITTLDGAVAAFVAAPPSDSLLEIESLGITSNPNTALVDVLDVSTPPREAGTYHVNMSCLVGMLATVANAGVRGVVTFTRTQGANVVSRQYEHNWNLQQPQTFALGIPFDCEQGAIIRVRLQVARIGNAATAQMAMARITAKKVG